jgi:hypothetical protein
VTCDLKAPERLLTIVREELQKQGIRMVPAPKSVWPTATLPEYLAQLPSSDGAHAVPSPLNSPPRQPVTERPTASSGRTVEKADKGIAKLFATPEEVVDAYRRAYAKKDWRICFLCLTPEARGETLVEFFFVAGMGHSPKLVKVIEKHIKVKFFMSS